MTATSIPDPRPANLQSDYQRRRLHVWSLAPCPQLCRPDSLDSPAPLPRNPACQFFMARPQELIARQVEAVVADPHNERVLRAHLLCAAKEEPLRFAPKGLDAQIWQDGARACGEAAERRLSETLASLEQEGALVHLGAGVWRADTLLATPAAKIGLRAIEEERFSVLAHESAAAPSPLLGLGGRGGCGGGRQMRGRRVQRTTDVIDEVEPFRLYHELYEGAIYLNQGSRYVVFKVDRSAKTVCVRLAPEAKYFTRAKTELEVTTVGRWPVPPPLLSENSPALLGAHFGPAISALNCRGFSKLRERSGLAFDEMELRMPAFRYDTFATWVDISEELASAVSAHGLNYKMGVHAAAHGLVNLLPLVIGCDAAEVGVECPDTASPMSRHYPLRLLFFDRARGGLGIAAEIHRRLPELLRAACEHMRACGCEDGCVCCTHSAFCLEYNARTDKRAGLMILEALLASSAPAGDEVATVCRPCKRRDEGASSPITCRRSVHMPVLVPERGDILKPLRVRATFINI
eukprot:CAMPEP_0179858198 /NCGR_PEP_ID=MMETSP0982-20121206/12230_1 /TAXON_ID=483367 /ORGANISM="non described non described, Strain CCMP 2436" /LENGTH=519 /DNA_ID=CAMNT_0021744917 /DNA_START=282 /DNA_END=1842 /DNA_ORIENTATION=+